MKRNYWHRATKIKFLSDIYILYIIFWPTMKCGSKILDKNNIIIPILFFIDLRLIVQFVKNFYDEESISSKLISFFLIVLFYSLLFCLWNQTLSWYSHSRRLVIILCPTNGINNQIHFTIHVFYWMK